MRRITAPDDQPTALPQYWLTYSDMMTQILAFFVVLISVSAVRGERFQKMMTGVREAFGYEMSVEGGPGSDLRAKDVWQNMEGYYAPKGHGELRGGAEVMNVRGREFLCRTVREGRMITLGETVGFAEGGRSVTPAMKEDLDAVVTLVKDYPNRLQVRAHVSARETAEGTLDWQLSFDRARAVASYLEQKGINPVRLRLSACGGVDPIDSNVTAEGRARNRRVEIVVSEELVGNAGAGRTCPP